MRKNAATTTALSVTRLKKAWNSIARKRRASVKAQPVRRLGFKTVLDIEVRHL